jgi:acetate CoA/acetoacetate CoA-transferase beta subunit
MMHTAKGRPKILRKCTLPLTSTRPVNLIVTELAVLEPTPDGMLLKEVAPGLSAKDVAAATDARLVIPTEIPTMRLTP